MRSVRGGGCCALFILSYPLSGPSSSDGVYVFSSRPLGPVEEEGGLELTRTASQHGRVSKGERVPGCCSEQSETAKHYSTKAGRRE